MQHNLAGIIFTSFLKSRDLRQTFWELIFFDEIYFFFFVQVSGLPIKDCGFILMCCQEECKSLTRGNILITKWVLLLYWRKSGTNRGTIYAINACRRMKEKRHKKREWDWKTEFYISFYASIYEKKRNTGLNTTK